MIRGIITPNGDKVNFANIRNTEHLFSPAVYPIVVSIAETQRENGIIHVSDLLSSPRQYWLIHRHDIFLDYEALVDRWLGNAIHRQIAHTNIGAHEVTFISNVAGVEVQGTADYYADKTLVDFKTCRHYMINWIVNGRKVRKTGEIIKGIGEWRPEWVEQLNMYRYLANCNNMPVERMQVVMIAKDAGSKQAIQVIDVPFINDIEQLMMDRLTLLQSLEDVPDKDLPLCRDRWDDDRLCQDYCDARKICDYALQLVSEIDF